MLDTEHTNFLQISLPFWDNISKIEQQLILNNAYCVHYKNGQHIFDSESNCFGITIIFKGSLRAYLMAKNGREITLYRLFDGKICILSASYLVKTSNFDANNIFIDAETDSSLIHVGSKAIKELLKNNLYIQNYLYKTVSERFSDVIATMEEILFLKLDKRLAIFLLKESDRVNSNTIKLTHEQIARYMSSAREAVSRTLKALESQKLVTLSRGGVEIISKIDLKKLTSD